MSMSDPQKRIEAMGRHCVALEKQLSLVTREYHDMRKERNVLQKEVEQLRQEVARLTVEASTVGKKVRRDGYYGAWRNMLSQQNEMQMLLARLNETSNPRT